MYASKAIAKAKPLSQCTKADIDRTRAIAKIYAGKRRPHLKNDFASYVMEEITKAGALIYNLHWCWATFLAREGLGNLKHKKGREKTRAMLTARSLDAIVPGTDQLKVKDTIPDTTSLKPEDGVAWRDALATLEAQPRAVAVLYFKWGFTGEEIAEVLGVTRARVMQVLDALEKDVRVKWRLIRAGAHEKKSA